MKKGALIFIILFAVAAGAASLIIYAKWNKPHENVEAITGIKVNAVDLFQAFSENERQATETYNGKVIEVTGTVAAVEKNQEGKTILQLQSNDPLFGINCTMEQETDVKQSETVTIKGVCSGFTTDIILIRCYLIKK